MTHSFREYTIRNNAWRRDSCPSSTVLQLLSSLRPHFMTFFSGRSLWLVYGTNTSIYISFDLSIFFFENISISNRHNKNLRAILAGNVIESSARKLLSVPMNADRHLKIKRESFLSIINLPCTYQPIWSQQIQSLDRIYLTSTLNQ